MTDPRNSCTGLATDISSSARANRRRTYHGPSRSSPERLPINITDHPLPKPTSTSNKRGSRATARKFLQQIVSSSSLNNSSPATPVEIKNPPSPRRDSLSASQRTLSSNSQSDDNSTSSQQSATTTRVPTMVAIGGGNTGIPSHQLNLSNAPSPRSSVTSLSQTPIAPTGRQFRSGSVGSIPTSTTEKPVAATSGGQITVNIQLAEPYLFVQGYDSHNQQNQGTPALLRGSLIIKLTKAAKIKAITLNFKGRARTEWPEGIPPRKVEFYEEKDIMNHTWPFFNAQFANAENSHGADSARIMGHECETRGSFSYQGGAIGSLARTSSPIGISAATSTVATDKRLSLQMVQSKSFNRSDSPNRGSVAAKGYRLFQPGDYTYSFELPLEGVLPETIQCDLGSVKYELEATVERAGAFRPNLVGKKDVILIRCPMDASLEQVEPIAISRNWEDQLHYDIVISGKSFPMGSQIPIAFKLTPLAKVRCHRIKIFVTENTEYFCRNKKVHRIEPTRKIQVYEKRADGPVTTTYPGSSVRIITGGRAGDPDNSTSSSDASRLTDNLLGDLTGDGVGPTEMEFSVKLPGCGAKDKDRIHFDTTYTNIQVHHWIKIVMRLSKVDPSDPTKRRHFEISIDSPFHILSCKCSQANTLLPAYNNDSPLYSQSNATCNCPDQVRRDSPIQTPVDAALPDTAESFAARPMHLLRAPSFNPPAFEDDVAPPSVVTPPPQYDSIVRNGSNGLADYFARLADTLDDDDVEDERMAGGPRTPGGRLVRSMDERRTWTSYGTAV